MTVAREIVMPVKPLLQLAIRETMLPRWLNICCLSVYLLAAPGANAAGLEEIVVTATKTGTSNVQQTALAITAINSEALREAQLKSLNDIPLLAPNVTISRNSLGGQLYIRGIGTNYIFVGGDPSSTVHVDGVYLARPTSVFADLLEIERIEVLRGPQGTLYGRNSTGGTINIITRQATQDFNTNLTVDLGDYDKRRIQAYVTGPIINDTLAANLALSSIKRDGVVDNLGPSNASLGLDKLNDLDTQKARLSFNFTPNNALQLTLNADYFERDETSPSYKPTLIREVRQEDGGSITIVGPQIIKDDHSIALNGDSFLAERHHGVNATLVWQLNANLSLTSITAYRETHSNVTHDTDNTELSVTQTSLNNDQHQISEEIQLLWKSSGLSWVNGLFVLREVAEAKININNVVNFNAEVATTSAALFSDLNWQITDQLRLIAGGRLSVERKTFDGLAVVTPINQDDNWQNFSPRLGLQWQKSENHMLFATLSQGFKSGGYNFTRNRSAYDEEFVNALELGSKISWPQWSSQLNSSFFYYQYKDLQLNKFVAEGVLEIENAADADVYGAELEWRSLLNQTWQISGSLAYLHATYEQYVTGRSALSPADPAALVDVSDNRLNSAPRWSMNLISDVFFDIAQLKLQWRLEYRWQDKIYFTPFNDTVTSQNAYGLLNTSLSYLSVDEKWQLKAYLRNADDKNYSNASQDFSSQGIGLNINDPKTYGIELRWQL